MESRQHALETAHALKEMCGQAGVPLIYKTSFDKANRTSLNGRRGLGLTAALPVFAEIRETLGLPVLPIFIPPSSAPSSPKRWTSCKFPPFFAVKPISY